MTTTHQAQALKAITEHPGATAAELVRHCTLFKDATALASVLTNLQHNDMVSRARTDGPRWRWWIGNAAPASTWVDPKLRPAKPQDLAGRLLERAARVPVVPKDKPVQEPGQPPKATAVSAVTPVITPDWLLYPLADGLLVINKETNAGVRLDVETVAAIQGMTL